MKKSLLMILNVFLLFWLISCSSSKFDPEKDEAVLREACEIPALPNTKDEGERDIIRSHAGVVSKFYAHESDCLTIENHYESILMKRVWEKVPSSYFSNFDDNRFRKGDVTISITCEETTDFRGIKRYSFSCSKGLY